MTTIELQSTRPPKRARLAGLHGELSTRQRTLTTFGTALVIAAVPIAALGIVDGRTFNGVGLWWKPAKFAISLGIYALTLAWAFGFVDEQRRSNRWMRYVVIATAAGVTFEQVVITVRAALAQGSHFNTGTLLDGVWYGLMGVGAVMLISTAGVLARQVSRSTVLERGAQRSGWIAGLSIASVIGGFTGIYMSSNPNGHWVGPSTSDSEGISVLGWSTTVGDLRVAHFLGLHAMFVLPLAGWAAQRWLGDRPRLANRLAFAASVMWVVIVGGVFARSVGGRPVP
jgi:hypothetical protein